MSDDQKIEFIDVRMRAARMEIETLRRERDEARCLSCISFENIIALVTTGIASAPRHKYYEHANGRGWDCFKDEIAILKAESAKQ